MQQVFSQTDSSPSQPRRAQKTTGLLLITGGQSKRVKTRFLLPLSQSRIPLLKPTVLGVSLKQSATILNSHPQVSWSAANVTPPAVSVVCCGRAAGKGGVSFLWMQPSLLLWTSPHLREECPHHLAWCNVTVAIGPTLELPVIKAQTSVD